MATARWTPIGDKEDGMIAVAIAASISFLSVVGVYLFALHMYYRHRKMTPIERFESESRGKRFLVSDNGLLWINLIMGDLIQAAGFGMNFRWIAIKGLPAISSRVCTAQAVLIQVGDMASAFNSLVIGIHIFCVLVLQYKPTRKVILGVMAFFWVVVAVLATIGPLALEKDGHPFYAPAGGWCWVSSHYQPARLYLHYLWVFVVAGVNMVLYGAIALKISQTHRQSGGSGKGSKTSMVTRVMMVYPLVYIATILPLASYRIAYLAGHPWSIQVQLGAGVVFTLSGACNVFIYVVTRQILTLDSVRKATTWVRRQSRGSILGTSGSMTGPNSVGVLSKDENRGVRSPEMVGLFEGGRVAGEPSVSFAVEWPRQDKVVEEA